MGIIYVHYPDIIQFKKSQTMAQIHVQAKRKSSSAWLWILISLIILGTIAFILLWSDKTEVRDNLNKPAQTSLLPAENRIT